MNDERERPAAADVRSRVIADCAALLPLASSACAAIKANQYLLQLRQVPAALLRPLRALVRSHSTEDWERTTEILNGKLELLSQTIRHEHERTRREIVKSINTRNIDGLDITGPRTQECRDQVMAVVIWLANPKHLQSLHHACDKTFRPIKNGYKDQDSLFIWCNRNESRIWAWVETYRLNHQIN